MWHPALYGDIDDLIQAAEAEMEPALKVFWERIGIVPEKWQLPPWGDEGGGFWVVALMGQECLYYNDIEDGFNVGTFTKIGIIDDYGCDQIELIFCLRSYYASFMQAIAAMD